MPTLYYGSEVWGAFLHKVHEDRTLHLQLYDMKNILEKFHSKVCKQALQVNKRANNLAVRLEMGRYPLLIYIYNQILNYYVSLLNSNKLVSKVIFYAQDQHTDSNSWLNTTIKIANSCSITFSKTVDGEKYIANKNVKETLKNMYNQRIADSVLQYSKLELYGKVKKNNVYEHYLTSVKNANLRRALTKYRICSHNLPIEKLRYSNTERQDRICHLCHNGIGDEKHYFMFCSDPTIYQYRLTFYTNVFICNEQLSALSEEDLFIYAISCCDKNINMHTANFVNNIQMKVGLN